MLGANDRADISAEPGKTQPARAGAPAVRAATNGHLQVAIAGRSELQLRARVRELEAHVSELMRCLTSAEVRASELLAMTARAKRAEDELVELNNRVELAEACAEQLPEMTSRAARAERELAVLASSKSWRMTRPLRRTVERLRRASSG